MAFKPETVAAFKEIYEKRKELLEYLENFGNDFEKAEARLVKEIAGCGSKGCSNVVQTQQPIETYPRTTTDKQVSDCHEDL